MSKWVKTKLGDSTVLAQAADDAQPADSNVRLGSVGDNVIDALDKIYDELVQNEIVENCRVLTLAFEKLRERFRRLTRCQQTALLQTALLRPA